LRADLALQHGAGNGHDGEEKDEEEKCAAGAGSHMQLEPPGAG
jgi:hypothetical protein